MAYVAILSKCKELQGDSLLHVLQENIGQSNAGDAFYRYKRPKLVARVRLRWPPLVLSVPSKYIR